MTSSVAYWMGTGTAPSGSTCVITVGTPGGTASGAGDAIIVGGSNSASSITISGVVDSAGNAYRQWNSSTTQNPTFGWIADSVNNPSGTAALPVGGTITVTFSGAGEKICGAVGCPGVSAAPIDQNPATTSNAGSTSPSITSGTLAQAVEMAVAIECNGNAGGTTMVWSGGFTSFFDTLAGSGGQAMSMAAKTTAATTAVTASGTITSAKWCMLLVTLKTSIPVITTSSLPGGTTGVSYSQTLGVSGGFGGFTWSVSAGSLPAGLSLVAGTGVISGTPHTAGTSSFTVTVTDGNANTAAQPLSITIASNLTVTTSALPGGGVGIAYSQALAATGGFGSYTWSVSSGSLPTGLSLSGGGTISGTPALSGLYSFTAQVADAGTNTATAALTIAVAGFPQSPLDVAVELDLGAWTDITTYTLQRAGRSPPITITSGRQNETSQATPSACAMQWNNRDGRFSPRNPIGPYYGMLGRNSPLRVSVPGASASLRLEDDSASYASTPGLNITGPIDVRVDLKPSGYYQMTLASQTGDWVFNLNSDGTLSWIWTETGGTIHTVKSGVPIPNLGRIMLRVSHNTTTGAVSFFTAATMGGTQALLASASTTIAGIKFTGGDTLCSGGPPQSSSATTSVTGRVYEMQVYNGIGGGGGTLAADPIFTAQTPGTTSFADAQANTWTLNGTATIDNRNYRGHFECSSLPQQWDPTGSDVWTPVSAPGVLRRLQQGNAQIQSAMRRAVLAAVSAGTLGIGAYWPCEDTQGSTVLASACPGGMAMQFTVPPSFQGTSGSLSADSQFPCSAQLPQVGSSTWTGIVTDVPLVIWNANVTRLLLFETAGTVPNGTVLARVYTNGTANVIDLYYGTGGGLGLRAFNGVGTQLGDTGPVGFAVDGVPVRVSIDLLQAGANATLQSQVIHPGSGAFTFSITLTSCLVELVTKVVINPAGVALGATEIGHISVQGTWDSLFDLSQPLNAWNGEAAGMRFQRVCGENGIQPRVYGFPQVSQAMGLQQIDTLANVLQSVEDSDRGVIYEPRGNLGLGYRTLRSLCNQSPAATLSYPAAMLGGDGSTGLEPVDDDQFTRNDVTVSRNGGSSAQVQVTSGPMSIQAPPAGVGDYATSITVYTNADGDPLTSIAGWIAWVGTTNQERYPVVPLNLARTELAGQVAAIMAVKPGDHIQITSPPAWLPPGAIDQLVYGAAEKLGGFWWLLAWNTVPELPYEVAVAGTGASDSAHADTAGSQLHSSVSSGATSLSVDTTTGPLWTTNAADFPFDIILSGEQITVTNITGASSPQTFTVTRSVNSVVKSQSAGTSVALFHTPVAALA